MPGRFWSTLVTSGSCCAVAIGGIFIFVVVVVVAAGLPGGNLKRSIDRGAGGVVSSVGQSVEIVRGVAGC